MKNTNFKKFYIGCKAIVILLILLALFFLAKNNLGYTGIWYDETASFWISQGLCNYSEVNEPAGGLRETIRQNRRANLDPGGQIVLLRLWTKFGKDLTWLRLFSFLFFLLSVAGMGLLAREWTGSSLLALFAMTLPFAYEPILYYAFEIRAYSMEVAGIIWGVLVLNRVFKKPDTKNFFVLGLICAAFMGSRYTYTIFVWSACFAGLAFFLKTPGKNRKKIVYSSFAFFAPVVVSGLLIYCFALMGQLAYGMGRGYMNPWMVHGKSLTQLLRFFQVNFLSKTALPITIALIGFFVIRPLVRHRFFTRNTGPDNRPDFSPFYWLILACQILSFFLSAAGFTPWYITTMWGLYLVGLSMIAALLLASELLWFFKAHKEIAKIRAMRYVRPVALIALLVMMGVLSMRAASYRHIYRADLAPTIEYLETLDLPDKSVFVAGYEIPLIRYLYEYGPYRRSDNYPRVFRFQTKPEWDKSVPIDAVGEGLLYFLTSHESSEEISRRLPRSKAQKIEGVNCYLLKVVPGD